jgi:hypothetical protein
MQQQQQQQQQQDMVDGASNWVRRGIAGGRE